MYEYRTTVLAVHDGDTLHLSVDLNQRMRGKPRDLGFSTYVEMNPDRGSPGLYVHEDFRLYGINAPELSNPDGSGRAALQYLDQLLRMGGSTWAWPIVARTVKQPTSTQNPEKQEKYGRWLATLWLPDARPDVDKSINQMMIDAGHAVPFMVSGTGATP